MSDLEHELRRAFRRRAHSAHIGPPPPLNRSEVNAPRRRRSRLLPIFAGGFALSSLAGAFLAGRTTAPQYSDVAIAGDSTGLPQFRIVGDDRFEPVSVEAGTVRNLRAADGYLQSFGAQATANPVSLFITSRPSNRPDLWSTVRLPETPVVVGKVTFWVSRGPGATLLVRWTIDANEYRAQSVGLSQDEAIELASQAKPRPVGGLDIGTPTAPLFPGAEGRLTSSTHQQRVTELGSATGVTLRVRTASDFDWIVLVVERASVTTRFSFERLIVDGKTGLLFANETQATLVWRPAPGIVAELRAPTAADVSTVAALLRSN
jgi:hypothetical protein